MKILLSSFILMSLTLAASFAQESTVWRGPSGNGVYPDKSLLASWPESGPSILWTYEDLGEGHSSVAIADGFIYLPTMIQEIGYIYKFTMDGKLVWKAPYGKEFSESYPGSRATATIAGEHLYILSGMGDLACLKTNDGSKVWTKNLFKNFDGLNTTWGLNETLVVDGDKLFCTPGGRKNNIVALNRFTGDLIWNSAGKGEKSAYCTPLLIEYPTRKLLVTHTESHILALDASNGSLLWSHPWPNQWSVHANTPIYHNNQLFCFSGYGKGAVMLELQNEGARYTKKWESTSFDNRIGGAVLVDGYIYGSGDKNRSWQCLDWNTGKQMYSSTDLGKGTVIAADDKLICYSERGELALVKANPSSFQLISKTDIKKGSGQHWAHPVIHEGILYLHRGSALIAFKIK
jgi:outer membrane protein assembly factor BamB